MPRIPIDKGIFGSTDAKGGKNCMYKIKKQILDLRKEDIYVGIFLLESITADFKVEEQSSLAT